MKRKTLFSSITRREADLQARAIRSTISAEASASFCADYDNTACQNLLADSSLAPHAVGFPANNPLRTLAYSRFVTEAAISRLLKTETDPARLAFVGARVMELGMHTFDDPAATQNQRLFLGASKEIGYFFTPPEVAKLIGREAVGRRSEIQLLLDPGAGSGALITGALLAAAESGTKIHSILALEIDPFTAAMLERLVVRQRELLGLDFDFQANIVDAVEYLSDPERSFAADCVVMNPPYGRMKFLRNSLTNAETRVGTAIYSLDEQEVARKTKANSAAVRFRSLSKSLGLGGGAQDYQRIFTALALRALSSEGRMAIITPSSWLGDKDSLLFRRHVLEHDFLSAVYLFPEDAGLFATVNQPTAVAVFAKGRTRKTIRITTIGGRSLESSDAYTVEKRSLERHDPVLLRIPRIRSSMFHVLEKLQAAPRLKDFASLRNLRGELDQTFGRPFMTEAKSGLRLIRGDHVERFVLRSADFSEQASYIDTDKFHDREIGDAKARDTRRIRIVGRQCSYMKKERRLSFALVEPRVILGNSCNYVAVLESNPQRERELLGALLTILNSAVLEWYFRIFSSNNHVANYEIDDFPLCLSNPRLVSALSRAGEFLTQAYSHDDDGGKRSTSLEDVADSLVAYGFSLDPTQTELVLTSIAPERARRVANMVAFFARDGLPNALLAGTGWYQHSAPSLSELDREVISHVPQGGNWQDIPVSVPGKRLEQIREMTAARGVVRTTYYGRLRPDQPAYTIATYYNRPGNGTNIHPWEERTLSDREAARLQSFPDDYVFLGSDTSARKQIGNAVPPLLARALGTALLPQIRDRSCVDLFSGAGGLSLGLEQAGWNVIAAVDHDRHATATYRFNRPCESSANARSGRTLILQPDLHEPPERRASLAAIEAKLDGEPLALLVGGPPCQGFSHAGWRLDGDRRNDLAMVFMSFVAKLQPEFVVLENVEGLLSAQGGNVVRDLLLTFAELGYDTGDSPWTLYAEQYGTPQMRRRVFLVGCRSGGRVQKPVPLFARCRGRREDGAALDLFSALPYPITVAEALKDLSPLSVSRHKSIGSRVVRPWFAQWAMGKLSVDEFLRLSVRDASSEVQSHAAGLLEKAV